MGRWIGGPRFGVSMVVVLLTAATARAGMIRWSYEVDVESDQPVPVLATQGSIAQQAGEWDGFPVIQLHDSMTPPETPSSDHDTGYDVLVNLHVTDEASGASGSLWFAGAATITWEWHSGSWEPASRYVDFGPYEWRELVLGETRFQFRGEIDSYTGIGYIVAQAEPVADPPGADPVEDTPEPATLGLAAVGLAVTLARKLRRRRA